MSSVINTNITSMIGQQNLNSSKNALATSMERLSSGLRINSAKDDAAGQAIANRMSAQITGLSQAQRNANDGISVAQTAEGALNQVNDNLQRVRELAVQAENGTNSQDDLNSIQNEINQRLDEIDRISGETSFNGTKVLQSDQGMKIQVGANDGEAITIDLKEINVKSLGMSGFNVTGAGEIDNTAATKDDLLTSGFTSVSTTNGIEKFEKETENTALTSSDLFSSISTGDAVETTVTGNDLNTAAVDGRYTYDADSDSFSFDAADVSKTNTVNALTPPTGETLSMTVNIQDGSGAQDIVVDSDGLITSADTGEELYLTEDGNLSQTNSSGSLQQATLDSLSLSMSGVANAGNPTVNTTTDATGGGAVEETDITFGDIEAGQTISIDDGGSSEPLTFTATEDLTGDQVAQAFMNQIDGNTVSGGTFEGNLDDYSASGVDAGSSSVSSNVLTLVAGSNETTADLTATGGSISETGGSFEVDGTTYTADAAGIGAFDVENATIGKDQLANVVSGQDHNVNVGGDRYQVSNGEVDQAMLDAYITEGEGFGDANSPASISVEFGNMSATETYSLDGLAFTASEDVAAEDVANAFADYLGGNTSDPSFGSFDNSSFAARLNTPADTTTSVDGGSLTITSTADSDGTTGPTSLDSVTIATSNGLTASDAYVNADGDFTTDQKSTTERFVQENGNVTDGAARQVFVDQKGDLTFDSVTESERSSLSELDSALSQVDSLRSDLGAIQNRMESAIENLSTTETNLSAARSRIEDADYATEVANMTKNQILQQAGTSVLAQANQIPQGALSLLG